MSAPNLSAERQPLHSALKVRKRLEGGTAHQYTVALAAGDFLEAAVQSLTIDVAVALVGPDGASLEEVDGPGGDRGLETLRAIAPVTADYVLEVRSKGEDGPAGDYVILALAQRTATDIDRRRVDAQRQYMTALEHYFKRTPDDVRAAIPLFEALERTWSDTGDHAMRALSIQLKGTAHMFLDNRKEAYQFLSEALPLLRTTDQDADAAIALNYLGGLYQADGNLQEALRHYHEALTINRSLKHDLGISASANNVGAMFFYLGEEARAVAYAQEALTIAKNLKLPRAIVYTAYTLGRAYFSMGDYNAAGRAYSEGLPYKGQTKDPRSEGRIFLGLASVAARQGDVTSARQFYSDAHAQFRSAGDFNGEATTVLAQGQLQQDTGDLAARATIEQALSMYRSRDDRLGELTALNALARLALASDPSTALDVTREAYDLAERLRALVVTPDLRATYLGAIQSVYENRIDATMLAWQQTGKTDRALLESAVEIAEHARARVMFESLSDLRGAPVRGADATLTQRERDLTAAIRALGVKRAAVPAGTSPADVDRELELAFAEYAVLQGEMRRQSADYAAVMHPKLPSLQKLRETLDADTAVLEYALGEQHSWAWLISRDDVQAFALPRSAAIETLGRQWHDSLQKGMAGSMAADELSRMLIEPLAAQLTRRRLAIVPSGVLHYLPFAAMTKPTGTAGPRGHTLNVDHELVMLPSLSTLARQRETLRGRADAPMAIAVFADPVFQPFDRRVTGDTAAAQGASPMPSPATSRSLPEQSSLDRVETAPLTRAAQDSGMNITVLTRLSHAAEEAKAVTARVHAGQALVATDFNATRELATSPAMKDYRILHFITHGFVDSAHPNLSGLVLSMVDRAGRRIDGFLRLLDIYAMDLSADLVVLSACETALGRNIRGEGMMGLTRGFMHAGARRVVSTLWKVDDRDTAAFMARFYENMLGDERLSPAAALCATQRSFAADPHGAATHLWAAFVLTGDWQ